MGLLEQLLGGRSNAAVDQISRQLGLDPAQAQLGLDALLPAVAAGLQRNSSTPQGLESLLGALTGGQHQRYVDDPSVLGQQAAIDDGNGILGHIFGSKDVSRDVAARASAQSGLGPEVLKRMLPLVAALVMGAMSSNRGQASGAGAGLPAGLGSGGGGGLLDMLTPLLDSNRDGSILDDVLGKFLR